MTSCDAVDLLGYLEGALDYEQRQAAERHLAGCDECRRSLEGLEETSDWLLELWSASGASCPSVDVLAEYLEGKGEEAHRETLRRHVEACPSCREFVEVLKAFEAEWVPDAEEPELPESIRGRLSLLAQGSLTDRLRRAAEEAMGTETPAGSEMAEWIKRILEPRAGAWPKAALPRDAAEVEDEDLDSEDLDPDP